MEHGQLPRRVDRQPEELPSSVLFVLMFFAVISFCAIYTRVVSNDVSFSDPSVGSILAFIYGAIFIAVYAPVALVLFFAYRRHNSARLLLVLLLFAETLSWIYGAVRPGYWATSWHLEGIAIRVAELACAGLLLSRPIADWYRLRSNRKSN
jgi:hypothetical protein